MNSDTIYSSRPWTIYSEDPTIIPGGQRVRREQEFTKEDFRFTSKKNTVYIFSLVWPDRNFTIKALGKKSKYLKQKIVNVSLLGSKQKIKYQQSDKGLSIRCPDKKISEIGHVFKVELK